jgi:hypothetical protein
MANKTTRYSFHWIMVLFQTEDSLLQRFEGKTNL